MTTHVAIKSIIERILHLKADQDAISDDIREIYTEAKSGGFDKTALGQAVTILRKREKLGADKIEEQSAIVDTYLAAFERGTDNALRARACAPTSSRGGTNGLTVGSHGRVEKGPSPVPRETPSPTDPTLSRPVVVSGALAGACVEESAGNNSDGLDLPACLDRRLQQTSSNAAMPVLKQSDTAALSHTGGRA